MTIFTDPPTDESSTNIIDQPKKARTAKQSDIAAARMVKPTRNAAVFRKDVDRWERQVLADPGLSAAQKLVAWAIKLHVNRETAVAWPGAKGIARCIDLTTRAIREAVSTLVSRGHLFIERHGGGRVSNSYRLTQPR